MTVIEEFGDGAYEITRLPDHAQRHTAVSHEEQQRRAVEHREQADAMSRARAREEMLRMLQAAQSPGGEFREEADLLVHCGNVTGGCSDEQHPIRGWVVTTAQTYRMNGDTGPFADRIERSSTTFDFLGDNDRYCNRCGNLRHLTNQRRPSYPSLSGHDQRALLAFLAQQRPRQMVAGEFFQRAQAQPEDDRVQQLEAQIAELRAMLTRQPAAEPAAPAPAAALAEELPPGIRLKDNGKYRIDYRDENGRQRGETHDTLEDAVRELAGRRREVAEARARKAAE